MFVMSNTWEIYRPIRKPKIPASRIVVSKQGVKLLLTKRLATELGINRLVQHASLRYDKKRNLMGVQFHSAKSPHTYKVSEMTAGATVYKTINIDKFMKDMVKLNLPNRSYPIQHEREGNILVINLNELTQSANP